MARKNFELKHIRKISLEFNQAPQPATNAALDYFEVQLGWTNHSSPPSELFEIGSREGKPLNQAAIACRHNVAPCESPNLG
jgi:hypothetical protein